MFFVNKEIPQKWLQIPPCPQAEKLFKCPYPQNNYQITVLTFQTPLHATSHLFHKIKIKYKSSLNTFKYGTKLVQAFGVQPLCHEYAIVSFEFIKVYLRRLWEISVTRNIKSRLAIKFPTPMSGDQMPSLPGEKRCQMPAVCRGGGC